MRQQRETGKVKREKKRSIKSALAEMAFNIGPTRTQKNQDHIESEKTKADSQDESSYIRKQKTESGNLARTLGYTGLE